MEVKINKENNVSTVQLIGRLDTPASQEVSEQLEPLMADASGTIVLDCTEMSYISSSGLRIFLSLRKAAASQGGKIIVKNITDDIRQVFMMTGFLNLFEIEQGLDAGCFRPGAVRAGFLPGQRLRRRRMRRTSPAGRAAGRHRPAGRERRPRRCRTAA